MSEDTPKPVLYDGQQDNLKPVPYHSQQTNTKPAPYDGQQRQKLEAILSSVVGFFMQDKKIDISGCVVALFQKQEQRNPDRSRASAFERAVWWHFMEQRQLLPMMLPEMNYLMQQRYMAVSAEELQEKKPEIVQAVYEKHKKYLHAQLEEILRLPLYEKAYPVPASVARMCGREWL